MTHLGKFLDGQQKVQGITGKTLAGRMSIDPTIISRAKSGEWRSFTPETLIRMVAGVSDDQYVKHQLVQAILLDMRDQCAGIQQDAIRITIKAEKQRLQDDAAEYGSKATPLLQAIQDSVLGDTDVSALTVIVRNFRKNPALRRLVLAAADLGRKTERMGRKRKK